MDQPDVTTLALVELLGIASAPMTAAERLTRAMPVLTVAGVSVAALKTALADPDLPWNQNQASALNVTPPQWANALEVSGVYHCDELGDFLAALHRSEPAAAMLRAGYKPIVDPRGKLRWSR